MMALTIIIFLSFVFVPLFIILIKEGRKSNNEELKINDHLDDIDDVYSKLEEAHESLYQALEQVYPYGVELYKKRTPHSNLLLAAPDVDEIKRLDEIGREHEAFMAWYESQKSFSSKSRSLKPKEWGNYSYNVVLKDIDQDGNDKDYLFPICQLFPADYCLDNTLDYTFFQYVKDRCDILNECKQNKRTFLPVVYDKLVSIIQGLSDKVLVLFSNSEDLNNDSIYSRNLNDYHFNYLRNQLDQKGIKYCDIHAEGYSFEKGQIIVIVEFDTTNARLVNKCQAVLKGYRDKRPCVTYVSMFKEYSSKEMSELIAKRTEEENKKIEKEKKKQQELDRQKSITNSLISAVASWGTVPNSDLHHCYIIRYYPVGCDFEATDSEWRDRNLIWGFKNDPNKKPQISYQQALDILMPKIKNILHSTFGVLLSNLTLVCIPASSTTKNEARFKSFSRLLCDSTGMKNAYDYIKIDEDREARHEGGVAGGTDNISFDLDFFKNKNVLLFDDVLTRGDSMRKFRNKISSIGANVIAGLTIGRTFHHREEDSFNYLEEPDDSFIDYIPIDSYEDNLPF